MQKITVNLKARTYTIVISYGALQSIPAYLAKLALGDSAYIVTNRQVFAAAGVKVQKILRRAGIDSAVKLVADSETSKSLFSATSVLNDLAAAGERRRIFIIALGGGVIGDLAGFVASVYKRGVPLMQIPTTLLAQVDSAIGGKNGVDLAGGKNLVGTFYQPALVVSDTAVLSTLPARQLRAGTAEIIKYAAIRDPYLFSYLEQHHRDIGLLRQEVVEHVICRCAHIKARIVESDERETKGIRTMLNFGHTIGHAIESAGHYRGHVHGEAVALGMLVAGEIGVRLGITPQETLKRLEALIAGCNLPTQIKRVSAQAIIRAHYADKKFIGGRNRFVMLERIGRVRVRENVPLTTITAAIKSRI